MIYIYMGTIEEWLGQGLNAFRFMYIAGLSKIHGKSCSGRCFGEIIDLVKKTVI